MNPSPEILYTNCRDIEQVAAEWDRLVPGDVPHLRSGFLAAIERSGMLRDLTWFVARRGDELLGGAVVYTIPMDSTAAAPSWIRSIVGQVRKLRPEFLIKPMRVCGSPISNAESGIALKSDLSPEERRNVFRGLTESILDEGGTQPTYFFKEFNEREVAEYASELEDLGFFSADPWAGTRIELPWSSFDDYVSALAKKYRQRIRKELRLAEQMELELRESFADLAPRAAELYQNVLGKAKFAMEEANEEFFAAVSDFDRSALLVARNRETGDVLGVNLLLFGDTCMHNLYIGFDYEQNETFHTYFNLVIESLRIAIERDLQTCFLGQDSYEFKARLGAKPVPLTAYMKHQVRFVHSMLYSNRETLFPPNEPVERDVFQSKKGESPAKESAALPPDAS